MTKIIGTLAFANMLLTSEIESFDGKKISLSSFENKVLLVVNIATQCGYTPQLEGLEALYQNFKGKGLVIIGIPSNDFGGQTPEDSVKVNDFCKLNYGVTFPLMKKVEVKGPNKSEFIKTLIASSENQDEIAWNFEKFLINKKGLVIHRFKSAISPNDPNLIKEIEEALK